MKRFRNLIAESAFGDDLADQALVTVLEVILCLRPSNGPCRLKQTGINRYMREGAVIQDLVTR